uniref:Mannosyltransferase n=1 Tax=Photinus pyralis TaxID=7054 RepID=A0A1Y1MD36_PHOPY
MLFILAIPFGIIALSVTVVIDSIFWNRPLWPEGEVLWFNTILNRSSDYGTSPFLWYFYSAIPRGLAASVFLVPIGAILDSRVRKLIIPPLLFVFLYSFLPHKELRFIIYIFPLLNVAAATACHRIWENRYKSPLQHLLSLGVCGHLFLNVIFTIFLLAISSTNYPGGAAMSHIHRIARDEPHVILHIDNLAAQSGVSRFTQIHPNWTYSKVENLHSGSIESYKFTHLIVEGKSKFSNNLIPYSRTHDTIDVVEAFHHISFDYFTIPPIKIITKPVLYILRRKDNYLELMSSSQELTQDNTDGASDEISEDEEINTEVEEIVADGVSMKKLVKELKADVIAEENSGKKYNNLKQAKLEIKPLEPIKRVKPLKSVESNAPKISSKITLKPNFSNEKDIEKKTKLDVSLDTKSAGSKKSDNIAIIEHEKKVTFDENVDDMKVDVRKESITELKSKGKTQDKKRASANVRVTSEKSENDNKNADDSATKRIIREKTQEIKTIEFNDPDVNVVDSVAAEIEPLESSNDVFGVKEQIRQVIHNFKQAKMQNLTNEMTALEAEKKESTKDVIKSIIRAERENLEREELAKIQEEILNIIDSNRHIINKSLIKDKVREAFVNYNLVTGSEVSGMVKPDKKHKPRRRKASLEYRVTKDNLKIKVKNTVFEGEDSEETTLIAPNEDQTIEIISAELDGYELAPNVYSDEESLTFFEEPELDDDTLSDFEKEFHVANKQIEQIIKSIDHIFENAVADSEEEI